MRAFAVLGDGGRMLRPVKVRVFLDFLVEKFAGAPWRVKAH
jgi:hypothetical protein